MKTIFIDLDGVLVDFTGGVCDLCNYRGPHSDFHGMEHRWMEKVCGSAAAEREFWATTACTTYFWSNLKPTPECARILSICESFSTRIGLLSSGACRPAAFAGKMTWVDAHLRKYRSHLFVGSKKELFAHGQAVLIDDWEKNILEWQRAGGHGILLPRAWNRLYGRDPLEVLTVRLEAIVRGGQHV